MSWIISPTDNMWVAEAEASSLNRVQVQQTEVMWILLETFGKISFLSRLR